MAAFLLSQIALSGLPLALFVIMIITVVIFSLIGGLLVGLLGAVLFIVFAVGVALIFILPVLFFTTSAAVFVWLFGVCTYYIIKWFNEKEVPGIHTDLAGGLAKASGLSDLPGDNGEQTSEASGDADENAPEKSEKAPEKTKSPEGHSGNESKGKTTGAQHHSDGKENSSHAHPRKLATKSNGVNDGAGEATETPKKKVAA